MTFKKLPLIPGLLLLLTAFLANADDTATSNKTILKSDVQTALSAVAKKQLVPGAIALLRMPGKTITAAYGTTEIARKNTPQTSYFYRIGSNTKSMISATIVLMAQDGLLQLTDPVSKYIPDVPNGDRISLDLLMKNRSGLYNYLDSPKLACEFDKNPLKIWTPQDLLNLAFAQPSQTPDERFEYSNTNFILLGLVAEKMDKKPLATIFKERLFTPLGMKHTYLPDANDTTMKKPYSHGYAFGGSAHVFTHEPYPVEIQRKAKSGKLKPVDYTVQSPSWAWAAGGVISTADDMAIWIASLAQGKLFNQEYYDKWLQSPVILDPATPFVKYGYGFLTAKKDSGLFFFHSGELPGFNSYMIYNQDKKHTMIIWSNLTVSLDVHPTAGLMQDAIFNAIYK